MESKALGSLPDDIYTDLGDAGDGLGDYGPGYPVSMSMQSGRRGLIPTLPDAQKMAYGVPVPIGFFGTLSDNEKRLAYIGAGVAALAVGWMVFGKKKGRKR
jgi:hypothetical protein